LVESVEISGMATVNAAVMVTARTIRMIQDFMRTDSERRPDRSELAGRIWLDGMNAARESPTILSTILSPSPTLGQASASAAARIHWQSHPVSA
jgi:hypothetical protein